MTEQQKVFLEQLRSAERVTVTVARNGQSMKIRLQPGHSATFVFNSGPRRNESMPPDEVAALLADLFDK